MTWYRGILLNDRHNKLSYIITSHSCIFFLVMRTFKIYSLEAFKYTTILLTKVAMLCFTSPGLTYLTTGSLHLLTTCLLHHIYLLFLTLLFLLQISELFLWNPLEAVFIFTLFISLSDDSHVIPISFNFSMIPECLQGQTKISLHI